MNDLLKNIDMLHTTILGIDRIKKNLKIDVDDVVDKMGLTIIDAFTLKPVKGNRIKGLVCISNLSIFQFLILQIWH